MAIVNATDIVVKINTTAGSTPADVLLHCTSASLSISTDLRDSTTKASSGFQENLAGLKSWEVSGDGFVDFAGTNDTQDLITEMLSATPAVEVSFGIAGTSVYTGEAFITSISVDAGVEENATYSISLQGTGALVIS
tara:strand:- start:872 stop:1282 length:411 start_codon:yes stop_codon:yes gene_type:complete